MYYIRKLNAKSSLNKLYDADKNNINELEADVVGREVRTQHNALSFWKCDDLDDPKEAVKAILLASNKIEATQFIIITDSILKRHNLRMDDSEVGVTAYKYHNNFHANMVVLNYGKIADVLKAFHDITHTKDCIVKINNAKAMEYIKEVIKDNLLDISMLETNSEPNFKALKSHLISLGIYPSQ